MRRLHRHRKKILFALVSLGLFWAATELVLSVTGWYKTPAEDVYDNVFEAAYRLLPGVHVPFGNAPVPGDPTNHAGFRGPEFTDEKPAGVYRVVAVGDSTTFGVTIPEPQTYPRLLEGLLNERKPRTTFEVLNAGVPGSNIFAHRIAMAQYLPRYHPDLVVLYVLFNSNPGVEILRHLEDEALASGPSTLGRLQTLLRHSRTYRLLRRWLKENQTNYVAAQVDTERLRLEGQSPEEAMAWVRAGFRQDLLGTIAAARQGGFQLVMVYHVNRPTLQMGLLRLADPRLPWEPGEAIYRRMEEICRQTCQEQGVVYLNVTDEFSQAMLRGEELFIDEVHFNAAGHLVMARAIDQGLLRHGKDLRLPPTD